MTLTKGRLVRQLSTFSKEFFFEIAGPITIKFHMQLLRKKRKQVYIFVTIPRWPPCPYVVKTLKPSSPELHNLYNLETWYVAFGGLVLQHIYK